MAAQVNAEFASFQEHIEYTPIFRVIPPERQLYANWTDSVQQARGRDCIENVGESQELSRILGNNSGPEKMMSTLFTFPL